MGGGGGGAFLAREGGGGGGAFLAKPVVPLRAFELGRREATLLQCEVAGEIDRLLPNGRSGLDRPYELPSESA